jgi:polar amino acid transport system substrate-binding protein
MKKALPIGLLVLGLAAPAANAADEIRLLAVIFPPIAIDEGDGGLSGLYIDSMREIAKRVGHGGEIEVLPLARLNEIAATEKNVIACVARSPERESKYQWIRQYGYDHMVLVTRKGEKFATLDDFPRTRTIGVSIGSSMEAVARRHGHDNLIRANSERANAEMLSAGRIDGWIAYRGTATYMFRRVNLKPGDFEFSEPVATMNYFIAASPGTPIETVQTWGAAFDAIVADGTYGKFYERYKDMIYPLAPR